MTDANIGKMIVAGAGPVGLTLALMLRRAGIDVTVVEKRATVNLQSKASTFHASTIDLLETCDVLDSMLAKGTRVDSVQYRAPDGVVLAQLDFDLLKDRVRNPFRMHYEQGELTTLMRDLFVKEGGDLRFNAGVSGVEQDDAGVTVTTEDGQTLRAGALFGCDGAQSFVREAVRIGYVEKPYPGMVLRLYAQTDMREIFPGLGGIAYLHLRDETCSLLEMPDCWRIVVRVPAGVTEAEAMTDKWVVDRLRNLLPIEKLLASVTGRDVYSARSRRAFAASAGRVYLAGDALHLTNTKG
ncbi:MAG: FAD-dependent monooxygenase, partial [Oricola sp.]|nr:FAD-dependent monooxygenase [Oricola sp.]